MHRTTESKPENLTGSKPEEKPEVLNPRNVEKWHTDDGTNPHPLAAINLPF